MYEYLTNLTMSSEVQLMLIASAEMFMQLLVELTLLFIVFSYIVALITYKLPEEKIQSLLGGKKGRGYLTAAGLGAITPFCSCSTIPMLVGLLKARAGFGPTMTFLFTSPLLNPIVIVLFVSVLGFQITFWYACFALVTSIFAGILLEYFGFDRYIKQKMLGNRRIECSTGCGDSQKTSCCGSVKKQEPTIWVKAWKECWSQFLSMFPYMLIAMLIGSFIHGFVPADLFAEMAGAHNPVAVPTAALIGIPLYIRVSALLPLVGSFVSHGVSVGAVIALIIGSGGASLPEMILLKKLFCWPLMFAFLLVIFSMAVIGGFTFNLFIN